MSEKSILKWKSFQKSFEGESSGRKSWKSNSGVYIDKLLFPKVFSASQELDIIPGFPLFSGRKLKVWSQLSKNNLSNYERKAENNIKANLTSIP